MKKRRLAIYAAIVIIFAVACVIQLAPSMIAGAADVAPAAIGTASLIDPGDTVFIREAIFTVGDKTIRASGFTVANAAAGENPAEGVNLDTLTPITVSKPLTGTLDKNIYVCSSDKGDIYLGDLKLAQGRKIYTDGSSLNFLGGSVEADSIETTGFIAVGSANVTVNSDLTGFNSINLFVSRSTDEKIAGFDTPSTMTVNGNVSNSGNMYNAAISAVGGSKMKVTGSINTEHAIVFCGSSLEVGGDVTIAQSHGGMCLNLNRGSTAVVGGKIKTNDWVHIYYNSSLKAGSVECTLLAATQSSYFEIENDVTVTWLDVSTPLDTPVTCSIGGNLKCTGTFINIVGSNEKPVNFYVGGDIDAESDFFTYYCNLDVDGGISRLKGGVFNFEYSTVDVAKDIDSNGNFELINTTMNVHGNVKDRGLSPISWSTLVVDGNFDGNWINPMHGSNVTVKGNLKHDGSNFNIDSGSTVKVLGDVVCSTDLDLENGSGLEVGGNLNATNIVVHKYEWHNPTSVTVDGNITTTGWFCSSPDTKLTVGGDYVYNYNHGKIEGEFNIGGDFVNNAEGDKLYNGLYVTGKLNVGGNLIMKNLQLNYDKFSEDTDLENRILTNRKADIVVVAEGSYLIEGVDYGEHTAQEVENGSAIRYVVPFNAQTVYLTINGEKYAADVRDRSVKVYTPVKIESEYDVTYELGGGAFDEDAVVEYRYFSEFGLTLPVADEVLLTGYLLEGWYDNEACEGDPVTEIPAGTTGDKTVYAKWNKCDHNGSDEQPDCENSAVCTLCGEELPALGHTWNEPDWNWDDVEHPTYSTTCSVCEAEKSGEADSVDAIDTAATVDADGFTTYTATVTLGSQVFTDDFVVTDEGSMLEARKAAFDEYKDDVTADIDALAEDGDSEQCKALIDSAKDAIDGVEYDESKSLDENKAAVDAAADLDALEAALEEHRKEYTATFTADGKTVKEVKFTIDTESIESEEPAVPEKEGYTGKWSEYALIADDIEVTAQYTPIEYTAKFVNENGETVKEVPYTVETESIEEPAVPAKQGYKGEWEDYTLAIGGVTVKPVYENITTIAIDDYEEQTEIGYKENMIFKATAEDMPEGAEIHWFVNGEDVGTGESYTVEDPTDDYTVQAKVLDKDGNVVKESAVQKVKVKNGFFDRLIAFILNLIEKILGKAIIDFLSSVC